MPHTYILFSKALNKFYVGATTDTLQNRLSKHLSNHKGFTAKAKDWIIVHKEEFSSFQLALAREKQIKKWKSRKKIVNLVGLEHPDLSSGES